MSRGPAVIGVDLACARWRDVGLATLVPHARGVRVEAGTVESYGLAGAPDPATLARLMATLAARHDARLLLLDGPGGWKRSDAHERLARRAEQLARTPGKAGLPGETWPRGFRRFVEFSIATFDALDALGWPRLADPARLREPGARHALETFPTASWRALGLAPLPGKSRTPPGVLRAHARRLARATRLALPRDVGHDALQAVVCALPGLAIGAGRHADWVALGEPLVRESGSWREGWIVLAAPPATPAATRRSTSAAGSRRTVRRAVAAAPRSG